MLVSIIVIIISFILDGILTNFLPYIVGNLSLFTPLTTLISITVIYKLFHNKYNHKKYFFVCFIVGFLYDLFYTNLLFFNSFLFLLIGFINTILYKQIGEGYIRTIINVIVIIILYELLTVLSIIMFNLVPINIEAIFYKISHSLILNILYSELLYIIINLIPKKYKKVRLN